MMGQDKLVELTEEYYSAPDTLPETVEEVIEDEFLELRILFKSRGVTLAGTGCVKVSSDGDSSDT